MAAKKDTNINNQLPNNIQTALNLLKKEFGNEAAMTFTNNSESKVDFISTQSLSLDIALGGGVPLGRIVEIYGPESSGKALTVDTLIPTPNGFKTMGEIQVGDTVFDNYGSPVKVTFVTPYMYNHTIYRVYFDDDSYVDADAEHIWSVNKNKPKNISIDDIINNKINEINKLKYSVKSRVTLRQAASLLKVSAKYLKNILKLSSNSNFGLKYKFEDLLEKYVEYLYKKYEFLNSYHINPTSFLELTTEALYKDKKSNYFIINTLPVQYEEKSLPIDPYIFGHWLMSSKNKAKCYIENKSSIIDIVKEYLLSNGYLYNLVYTNAFNERIEFSLSEKNLERYLSKIKSFSNSFRIPDIYLFSSISQRSALLSGIIDSAGIVNKDGTILLTNVNHLLLMDIKSILNSLGVNSKIVKEKVSNDYVLSFTKPDLISLVASKAKLIKKGRKKNIRKITKIIPLETQVPVKCIQVDSLDHLYLCGEYIPTHNTTLALHICKEAQSHGYAVAYIDLENALDATYMKKLGCDLTNMIISQPSSGEEAFQIAETLLKNNCVNVIIFDSVASMLTKAEIEGEVGDSFIGVQARLMSSGLKKITPLAAKANCLCIFINQIRNKIGVMFGCLHGETKINFDDGRSLPIGEVVKNKIQGNVYCMLADGTITSRPIINWFDNGEIEKKSDMIKLTFGLSDGIHYNSIVCTPNHKVFTSVGWVEAKDAKDILVRQKTSKNNTNYEYEVKFLPITAISEISDHEFEWKNKYDIQVKDAECYFAGLDNSALVHNSPETTPGGEALKFYSSQRMRISKVASPIKQGEEAIGNETKVKVLKNKIAPPFKEANFKIIYGKGISRTSEILALGVKYGFIEKGGSYYKYEGNTVAQGELRAIEWLDNNIDLREMLYEKIKQTAIKNDNEDFIIENNSFEEKIENLENTNE